MQDNQDVLFVVAVRKPDAHLGLVLMEIVAWRLNDVIARDEGDLRVVSREPRSDQEQLEARSGFSQQYLSGLEQGRRNPTVVTVYELAQALGVGHLDLLQPDDQD